MIHYLCRIFNKFKSSTVSSISKLAKTNTASPKRQYNSYGIEDRQFSVLTVLDMQALSVIACNPSDAGQGQSKTTSISAPVRRSVHWMVDVFSSGT
jgi:hypothetical protein